MRAASSTMLRVSANTARAGAVSGHNAYDSCHIRLFLLCSVPFGRQIAGAASYAQMGAALPQIRFSTKNAFSLSAVSAEKSVPPNTPQTAKPARTAARSMRGSEKQRCTATSSKRS